MTRYGVVKTQLKRKINKLIKNRLPIIDIYKYLLPLSISYRLKLFWQHK